MQISNDTENVLAALDKLTDNSLRKRNDFATLLEIGASCDSGEAFNDLIFSGTTLWKVYAALRRVDAGAEGETELKRELARAAKDLTAQLKNFADYGEKDDKKRFDRIYFAATEGALLNLIDIACDFAALKELQNRSKGR